MHSKHWETLYAIYSMQQTATHDVVVRVNVKIQLHCVICKLNALLLRQYAFSWKATEYSC